MHRGGRTQAANDTAARTVSARKGILATTIAGIAAQAGRSAASFYRLAMVNDNFAQRRAEISSVPTPLSASRAPTAGGEPN